MADSRIAIEPIKLLFLREETKHLGGVVKALLGACSNSKFYSAESHDSVCIFPSKVFQFKHLTFVFVFCKTFVILFVFLKQNDPWVAITLQ